MQFGRTYEEFEVGAVYKHWPGKTVTEYDDHLFCLLTMNHHPLHLDANYAEQTTDFGRNVVVGNYIYSLLLGMSVPDVSGKAIANLEVESLKHVAPTFHGDTIYGETTVLGKWPSKSKDDRGIVHVAARGCQQHRARQVAAQVEGRPGHRPRRDPRLQAGRHPGVHLPPEGDGADRDLHQGARRRAARTSRAGGLTPPRILDIPFPPADTEPRHGTPRTDRGPDRDPAGHPRHGTGLCGEGDHAGRHRDGAQGHLSRPDRRGDETAGPVRAHHPRGVRRPGGVAAHLRAGRGGDRPRLDVGVDR